MTDTKNPELMLDASKIAWHLERVEAWKRGERIAPITIDMALTRSCNYSCHFCYAMMQENEKEDVITKEVMDNFLEDSAEMGVKSISFISDGESTISPVFSGAIKKGYDLGLSMAAASNGFVLTKNQAEKILPYMEYLRINFSAGEAKRYSEIMGCKESYFHRVCKNISDMMEIKRRLKIPVTIGMQMVLMPKDADQIVPFAKLGAELKPDYAVIKHCADNEDGDFLGIDYNDYENVYPLLEEAEKYSTEDYKVIIKWSKIKDKGNEGRTYQRCYGVPFHLQLSGSGLIAPCGPLFNEKYKKVHIGNIVKDRFKDIIASDRYWEVVNYLSSSKFNAQTMCSPLCMQHKTNEVLDAYVKGEIDIKKPENTEPPLHKNFI
ncbi:radical SAM protein [Candidatus Pelagibacter sp.]|nr:radical SAM protein [Candidatus Pelagibacter sp.]